MGKIFSHRERTQRNSFKKNEPPSNPWSEHVSSLATSFGHCPSGVKEAAEKGHLVSNFPEERTAGAEARVILLALSVSDRGLAAQ
jgi:hypothetical protein